MYHVLRHDLPPLLEPTGVHGINYVDAVMYLKIHIYHVNPGVM